MGKSDPPLDLGNRMELHLPSDVYVIGQPDQIDILDGAEQSSLTANLILVRMRPDETIPSEIISKARILVLEVDRHDPASLNRVAQVRAARSDLPVIVALDDASVSLVRALMRQGVTNIISLPFNREELISEVLDVGVARANSLDAQLAPMVSVLSSTSGGGATTILTHLAGAFVDQSGMSKSCCVIDLDVQFGEAASYLNVAPALTVMDLLAAGDRLDAEFMRSAAKDTGHGFSLVSASRDIAPLESIDVDQLLRLLDIMRQEFDLVLIDLPKNWTNWTLSAALACTQLMLVTDQSLRGIRQGKRILDMFSSVGLDQARCNIVVNRVEKRLFQTISVREVEDAMGREVCGTVASDPATVGPAQDQGLLAWDLNKRSRFVSDVRDLNSKLGDRFSKGVF